MGLECVITSDFHLDAWKRFFPNADMAVRAQIEEIEKPFKYAIDNNIDRVFILGDIGEHPVLTEESRYWFLDLLVRYDGRLSIDVILGNHDFATDSLNNLATFQQLYNGGKFQSIRFFNKLHQETFEGVPVNYLPYPLTKPPKADYPSLNLAHVEINGAARDNGYITDAGLSLGKSKDWWVSGHYHTHQFGPNWVYCGNLYQKNFGERLPKGWLHVRCDPMGASLNFRYRFIENTPRITLHTVEVLTEKDYGQVTRDLNKLYKIKLQRDVGLNQAVLSAPNVVGYELIGRKAPLSVEAAKDVKLSFSRENSLDPTEGLRAVLEDTLEKDQVEAALVMARAAAARALEQLEEG